MILDLIDVLMAASSLEVISAQALGVNNNIASDFTKDRCIMWNFQRVPASCPSTAL